MGRFAKNKEVITGSKAIRIPLGTNTLAPNFPVNGQVRFNTETGTAQYFYNGVWNSFAISGKVLIEKDTFTGNGVATTFTPMAESHASGNEAEILVFIGNIFQEPGVAYTVNAYGITFSSPPDLGSTIVILHNFNSTVATAPIAP
jgi:F0F1-type ATP synthase beta subunit